MTALGAASARGGRCSQRREVEWRQQRSIASGTDSAGLGASSQRRLCEYTLRSIRTEFDTAQDPKPKRLGSPCCAPSGTYPYASQRARAHVGEPGRARQCQVGDTRRRASTSRQHSGVDPVVREGSSTHTGDLASPVIAGVPELRTRIQVGGSRGSDRQRSRLQTDGRARARETTESPCQHSVADLAARTSARRRRIELMLALLAGELEHVVPAGQQHSDGRSSSTWWSILQHSRTHVGPVRGRARGCDARRTVALRVIRWHGLLLPVAIHDGLMDVPSIVPSLRNVDSG
ncbi:hypothetical protein B0H10DRAFT_153034 [Mycena sp. CBHHK59/15]|nr:hypothetical protein B0H10DRAFT_153034 [Mycena sp. CBHHK59/15]